VRECEGRGVGGRRGIGEGLESMGTSERMELEAWNRGGGRATREVKRRERWHVGRLYALGRWSRRLVIASPALSSPSSAPIRTHRVLASHVAAPPTRLGATSHIHTPRALATPFCSPSPVTVLASPRHTPPSLDKPSRPDMDLG
jgi:hypothetical protein